LSNRLVIDQFENMKKLCVWGGKLEIKVALQMGVWGVSWIEVFEGVSSWATLFKRLVWSQVKHDFLVPLFLTIYIYIYIYFFFWGGHETTCLNRTENRVLEGWFLLRKEQGVCHTVGLAIYLRQKKRIMEIQIFHHAKT
jgi:hypothetical protein